jgi:Family of unknown function (DUF6290)
MSSIPLSTTIAPQLKRAALAYCKKHGVKLSALIEQALAEKLEDDLDLNAYEERKNEPTTSLNAALEAHRRKVALPLAAKQKRARV